MLPHEHEAGVAFLRSTVLGDGVNEPPFWPWARDRLHPLGVQERTGQSTLREVEASMDGSAAVASARGCGRLVRGGSLAKALSKAPPVMLQFGSLGPSDHRSNEAVWVYLVPTLLRASLNEFV